MNIDYPGIGKPKDRIVYVRPVQVADLPEDIRSQVDTQIGGSEVIYSLHDPEGKQLALVANRQMAFQLAIAHDYAPVSTH